MAIGGIGASLGALLNFVWVFSSLFLMVFPPPGGGGGGTTASLSFVLATQGSALVCYLAALAGAGITLWGRERAALMAGGAAGAVASGVAYVLLFGDGVYPARPAHPQWPAFGLFPFP